MRATVIIGVCVILFGAYIVVFDEDIDKDDAPEA